MSWRRFRAVFSEDEATYKKHAEGAILALVSIFVADRDLTKQEMDRVCVVVEWIAAARRLPVAAYRLALASMLMSVIVGVAGAFLIARVDSNTKKVDRAEHGLRVDQQTAFGADIASCKRQRTIRSQANRNAYDVWRFARTSARVRFQSAVTDKDPKQRAIDIAAARDYIDIANDKRWYPQPNCFQAVRHPNTYVPPGPQPFPPPPSGLP